MKIEIKDEVFKKFCGIVDGILAPQFKVVKKEFYEDYFKYWLKTSIEEGSETTEDQVRVDIYDAGEIESYVNKGFVEELEVDKE